MRVAGTVQIAVGEGGWGRIPGTLREEGEEGMPTRLFKRDKGGLGDMGPGVAWWVGGWVDWWLGGTIDI